MGSSLHAQKVSVVVKFGKDEETDALFHAFQAVKDLGFPSFSFLAQSEREGSEGKPRDLKFSFSLSQSVPACEAAS